MSDHRQANYIGQDLWVFTGQGYDGNEVAFVWDPTGWSGQNSCFNLKQDTMRELHHWLSNYLYDKKE